MNDFPDLSAHGLTVSPIAKDDVDDWLELVLRIAAIEQPRWHAQRVDLLDELESSTNNPERNTVLARDAQGIMRAYATVTKRPGSPKAFGRGGVDPQWQRRGIGTALMQWLERRTEEVFAEQGQPAALLRAGGLSTNNAQQALYASRGMQIVRYFDEMLKPLDASMPQVSAPQGIRIELTTPGRGEDFRQAHNEAFADHWGSDQRDQEAWEQMMRHPHIRLDWSTLAIDEATGEVAGYQLASYDPKMVHKDGREQGHTELLGVRRAWRRRGIAPALLADAMARFAEAGMTHASLEVDSESPTGAHQLYSSMGYERIHRFVAWDKPL